MPQVGSIGFSCSCLLECHLKNVTVTLQVQRLLDLTQAQIASSIRAEDELLVKVFAPELAGGPVCRRHHQGSNQILLSQSNNEV